jgi:exopolysaccharide production protein ExoY
VAPLDEEAGVSAAVLESPVAQRAEQQADPALDAPHRFKRPFDVVTALGALVVLAPLLILVALAVTLSDGGPVLFRQTRLGRDGRRFQIAKFRTMATDAEARLEADPELHARYVANCFKLHPTEDPRIGRLGRFLRASSLDELPQLFNVISGEMSMVGPRPIVEKEIREYEERGAASSYLAATPGITGLWQVSGRSNLCYSQRIDLDVAYMADCSLANDLRILARTPLAVLQRSGAY